MGRTCSTHGSFGRKTRRKTYYTTFVTRLNAHFYLLMNISTIVSFSYNCTYFLLSLFLDLVVF
jgi:hypothetical protein